MSRLLTPGLHRSQTINKALFPTPPPPPPSKKKAADI